MMTMAVVMVSEMMVIWWYVVVSATIAMAMVVLVVSEMIVIWWLWRRWLYCVTAIIGCVSDPSVACFHVAARCGPLRWLEGNMCAEVPFRPGRHPSRPTMLSSAHSPPHPPTHPDTLGPLLLPLAVVVATGPCFLLQVEEFYKGKYAELDQIVREFEAR